MEKHKEITDNFIPCQPRFEVPEGYFDSLPGRIMARIDSLQADTEEKRHRLSLKVARRYVAAAACVAVMAVGITAMMSKHSNDNKSAGQAVATTGQWPIDQMTDYMMLDNNDIYAMLAE